MNRVLVLFFAFSFYLASVGVSLAAHKNVLIFNTMNVDVVTRSSDVIKSKLARDYHEVSVDLISADGDKELGRLRLQEALSTAKYDLVISIATMASILTREELAGRKIPQLFLVVGDPVGAGLVDQIGQSTAKMRTGIAYGSSPKLRVSAVSRILKNGPEQPGGKVKVVILSTTYPSSMGDAKNLAEAGDSLGMSFIHETVEYEKFPDAYEKIKDELVAKAKAKANQFDYLWETTGPFYEEEATTRTLIQSTAKPVIYGNNSRAVKNGALFSAQVDIEAQAEEASNIALRILRGENAGQIPVKYSTTALFSVNLRTADQLRVRVPLDILKLSEGRIFK